MNEKFVYPNAELHNSRTKFSMAHTHKTSLDHSFLYPIDVIEVVPGDTFELKVASLIRMSNPIAPIMDNIEMHVAAYYVPLRLLWENYEEFEGVNKTGAWYNSNNTYTSVPVTKYGSAGNNDTMKVKSGDLLEMLGYPVGEDLCKVDDKNAGSILPLRAYFRIWNEHYRNANVSAPVAVDYSANDRVFVGVNMRDAEMSDINTLAAIGLNDDNSYTPSSGVSYWLMRLAKFPDVFTKCLPAPQRGPSVEYLPDLLPVDVGVAHATTAGGHLTFNLANGNAYGSGDRNLALINNFLGSTTSASSSDLNNYVVPNNLYADLNKVSKTINDLRLMFQIQKYFEKDARYGVKNIAEKTLGHFGVRSPDATIQQSQYLGELNFHINVEQVLSTAGAADDSTSKLGQPGANSVTAGKGDLGTFSFTERGYIIIVAGARHDHTYANATLPYLLHKELFDFYDPLFANIGEFPVSQYVAGATDGQSTNIFGYQEAFYDYRFLPSRVTGALNPGAVGSLNYWTLADAPGARQLNEAFIYENRDSISRALTTGSSGPDYIVDFYFMHTAVRPMPLFSIPGLVDHH